MAKEKKPTTPAVQMTPEQLDAELKRLEVIERQLRVEDLSMRVENERARRNQVMLAHEAQQRSLDEANANIKAQQTICRHKKGGRGMEGIIKGNDSKRSVIKHTYPWGEKRVQCTRCGREWAKPKLSLKRDDPDAYKVQLAEYIDAVNFETDNEDSGSQIFLIERSGRGAEAIA